MNEQEYTTAAQSTNAPITPELLTRLTELDLLHELKITSEDFIGSANQLEKIKKHIFYGKPFSPSPMFADLNQTRLRRLLVNPKMVKLVHGILGKCTEAGELMQALIDHLFNGMDLDETNLIEEMGDDFWYNVEVLTAIKVTREEVEERNIAKLRARYPEKFTEEAALNRDLVNERQVLEETDEITSDFIGAFPNKDECKGAMARIIASCELPEGVNPDHPQVKQIIQWCKENYETKQTT